MCWTSAGFLLFEPWTTAEPPYFTDGMLLNPEQFVSGSGWKQPFFSSGVASCHSSLTGDPNGFHKILQLIQKAAAVAPTGITFP